MDSAVDLGPPVDWAALADALYQLYVNNWFANPDPEATRQREIQEARFVPFMKRLIWMEMILVSELGIERAHAVLMSQVDSDRVLVEAFPTIPGLPPEQQPPLLRFLRAGVATQLAALMAPGMSGGEWAKMGIAIIEGRSALLPLGESPSEEKERETG